MLNRLVAGVVAVCLSAALVGSVRADFLVYRIGGNGPKIVIEGKVNHRGRFVQLVHPKFGSTVFNEEEVTVYESPDRRKDLRRDLAVAARNGNASRLYQMAGECINRGWVEDYLATMEKVKELDAEHVGANSALKLDQQIKRTIPESSKVELELRTVVPLSKMRIVRSPHFILLTDTPEKSKERGKKNRAEQRLELLEQVYESFLHYFNHRGVELEVPQERLKTVLFEEKKDYLTYSSTVHPSLVNAAGFCDTITLITFFYDHGSESSDLVEILQEEVERWKNASNDNKAIAIRFINGLTLLIKILEEETDVTVVTHEATHQLAGATGLFPQRTNLPHSLHEGLATFFEAPENAGWSGIGGVNVERMYEYRRKPSSIEYIISNKIFLLAETTEDVLNAYANSWALTHFLMNKHFDELMQFYHEMAAVPRDLMMSSQVINEIFDSVFDPGERKNLDREWRLYVQSLETEFEKFAKRR